MKRPSNTTVGPAAIRAFAAALLSAGLAGGCALLESYSDPKGDGEATTTTTSSSASTGGGVGGMTTSTTTSSAGGNGGGGGGGVAGHGGAGGGSGGGGSGPGGGGHGGNGGSGGTGGGTTTTSSSSTGGGGGAGGGGICVPLSTKSCYTGPGNTQGVGPCKAGLQTCSADGSMWSGCVGQVLPGLEDCATAADEDCNGSTPICPGGHLFSTRFGDGADQNCLGLAVDGVGEAFLAGALRSGADFGGGTLTSAGMADVFVAKFGANNQYVWAKRFGDAADQFPTGIDADAAGNTFVTGQMQGSVDFGNGAITSAGNYDAFLAKLDASGNAVWSARYGDAAAQLSDDVAVDKTNGDVVIVGQYTGTIDLGGGPTTSTGGFDCFIARYNSAGTFLWSKTAGTAGDQICSAVTVDANGAVIVTGRFANSVNFGGINLVSAGAFDVFVVKYTSAGGHVWSKSFGSNNTDQVGAAVAVDPNLNILVAGRFAGSVDFGGGQIASAGLDDAFVAKFDPAGAHVWSKAFGDNAAQSVGGVGADALGNVLLAGSFQSTISFGGPTLNSAGFFDMFVAKLDPAGSHVWSKAFGDVNDQVATAISADPSNNVVVTGHIKGVVNFGGGQLSSAGGYDVFLAKFSP